MVSNGAAAPSSSSALSPPQVHASQAPAAAAASARAAPGAGIFDGVHGIDGDLVDLLQRNGTFAFLEDLLQHYDCTDQPAAAQLALPSGAGGGSAANAGANPQSQHAGSRTTTTANSFFRSSTASTRHSNGVSFPPRRLPALRTSSPLGPAPFCRNSVPRSSSPMIGGASRKRQGPRPLLEAPFRGAFGSPFWKPLWPEGRPAALGDVLHIAKIGLEFPCFPLSPATITARLLSTAAKNTDELSRRPHQHVHSSLRCNQGARLDGVCPWPSLPHSRTHGPHPLRSHGKRGPTALRRGDPQ